MIATLKRTLSTAQEQRPNTEPQQTIGDWGTPINTESLTTELPPYNGQQQSHGVGSPVTKTQKKMFCSRGGDFLTFAIHYHRILKRLAILKTFGGH